VGRVEAGRGRGWPSARLCCQCGRQVLVPLADATGPLQCSVRLLGDLAREVGAVGPTKHGTSNRGELPTAATACIALMEWPARFRPCYGRDR